MSTRGEVPELMEKLEKTMKKRDTSRMFLLEKCRPQRAAAPVSAASPARRPSAFRRAVVLHEVDIPDDLFGLFAVAHSPGGSRLACGFGSGAIEVREAATGVHKATVRRGAGLTAVPIVCARFHPKSESFYAVSACGTVFICSASSYEYSRFCHEQGNEVNALAVDLSGERVVTGGKDAALRLYDSSSGRMVSECKLSLTERARAPHQRAHTNRIFCVVSHNLSAHTFVSGGWDDAVKVWDSRAFRSAVGTVFGPHICGDAIDVRGDRILTGSWRIKDSVQTWDLRTFRCISTMSPMQQEQGGDFVYVAKFLDGDPYGDTACVGGSGSRAMQFVSLSAGKVVEALQSSKTVQAMATDGALLVYGGMEPVIRIAAFS